MFYTDFLRLAERLSAGMDASGLEAAVFRTAISRAYYAAYHRVYAFLRSLDCPIERGGKGHTDIHHWLNAAGVQDLAYASSLLADLQEMRLLADYALDRASVENATTASAAIRQADEIVSIIDEAEGNPAACASIRSNLRAEALRRRASRGA